MQDRYAGDIGDYIKLGLLKALAPGRKLGVAWYKTPDSNNNDGRHVNYLDEGSGAAWAYYDPELYAGLRKLVHENRRSVSALEPLLTGDVRFAADPLVASTDRSSWFKKIKDGFQDRNLIFVDPDNGIDASADGDRKASIKCVTLDEIKRLSFLRPLIVYHHQTRFKGGHLAEIEHLGQVLQRRGLGCILALRARSWSPRVFFIVEATAEIWAAAETFAGRWAPHVTFHAIDGPPDSLGLPPSDPYSVRAEQTEQEFAERIYAGEFDRLFPNRKNRKS